MKKRQLKEAARKRLPQLHGDPMEESVLAAVDAGYQIGSPACHVLSGKAIQPPAEFVFVHDRPWIRNSLNRILATAERVESVPTIFPAAADTSTPDLKQLQVLAPQFLTRRQVMGLVQSTAAEAAAKLPVTDHRRSK